MYKYSCPRWWGTLQGLRNMNADNGLDDKAVIEIAHADANKYTGSKNCDISLLQKFHVSITPIKNYAALTSIPFSVPKNNIIGECKKKPLPIIKPEPMGKPCSKFTKVSDYN